MSKHRAIVVVVALIAVVLFAWARAGAIRQQPGPRPVIVSTQGQEPGPTS